MPIHNPLHPGEIVYDVLIEGAGLSITEAAKKLGINRATLSRLLNGHVGISAVMALRLSKLLPDTDMALWMNLQRDYDIWLASKHANKIHIKPLKTARGSFVAFLNCSPLKGVKLGLKRDKSHTRNI